MIKMQMCRLEVDGEVRLRWSAGDGGGLPEIGGLPEMVVAIIKGLAQNEVVERKNRHMLKVARVLLFQMTVPKPFWVDAISMACFLINRMPSIVLGGNYPYSVLFPTKPLFPSILKSLAVRVLFRIATYDWALHQLDVKNDFLHGDLEEEVYMKQPPRFVAQGEFMRVCKLKKSLYGLKQSLRAWFGKFSNVVIEFGLRRSVYDHYVFYSSLNAGCILLVVYVDDIVITDGDKAGIKKLKSFIGTCFQTKNLRKYCLDLLDDAGQIEAKPYDEPMIPKLKLRSEDRRLLHNHEKYRRVVGKLNYLTITPPDIAFSSKKQNVVSRSSSEAEYRAMAQTTCELVWLHNLLGEIGFPQSKPMKMWCDNQAAIYIATNLVFHEMTKHIEVDCHFTREKLKDGTIITPHIRTKSQLADVLTKALLETRINSICNKLGMINIYAQLEGEC
nr:cysteine-rich RLK (receptor-like protein kinase) 8 [Tanacetum cinerariifolium]